MADDPTPTEGEDERIEVDLEDDETSHDPEGEPETAEGDEPENEAEPLAAGDAEPPAPPSRAERRIRALDERYKQVAEENARITRQLDELRRNPPQPQQPAETAIDRANRLALLSPEDRLREEMREALDANERKNQNLTAQLLDQSDQASFSAQAAVNPLAKKLASEVERRLADLRARGQNLPRNVVFTYLIGERVLAQQGKKSPKAAANRQRQQARPANTRGDVQPNRRNRGSNTVADMEAQFGDVPI